jgi:soluble lytic murein transglycosylase-like protein
VVYLFQTSKGGGNGQVLPWNNIPADWRQDILTASQIYGVNPALVAAVIQQESSWNPNAFNSKYGAAGLGQIIPSTAKSLGITNVYDPKQNIYGVARLLADNFRATGTVEGALARYYGAYDSGYITSVQNYKKQYESQIQ